MTIWRDPSVTWGGMAVGGIRISHMSHMERDTTLAITESKTKRKPLVVRMLTVAPTETPDAAYALARAAAANGKAAFTTWWQSDEGRACRQAVQPIMPELQAAVAAADAMPDDEAPM